MNEQNAVGVILKLFKNLNVKFTMMGVRTALTNHPNYPSLASIEDFLADYFIATESFHTDDYKGALENTHTPFIAQLSTNGGCFILVEKITENHVIYSNEYVNGKALSINEFIDESTGIFMEIERNSKTIEPNYKRNFRKQLSKRLKLPLLILSLLSILVLALTKIDASVSVGMIYGLKVLGVTVTIFLLFQNIGLDNSYFRDFCSFGGESQNCNAILKSRAANVFEWLTLSELGFFYFAGSLIVLVIFPKAFHLLLFLNLVSLPFILFSIGYQYLQKKWCILCCIVQFLLLCESITFWTSNLGYDASKISFPLSQLFASFLSLSILILSWSYLKLFLVKSAQLESLKQQFTKFKYNNDLFKHVLVSQDKYEIRDELMPIYLGNPEAQVTITIVSNPFCLPCARAHKIIVTWLQHRDDVKFEILFAVSADEGDLSTKVAEHMSALSKLNDPDMLEVALDEWYSDTRKKYEVWANKFPVLLKQELDITLIKQREWCKMAKITATPTIFIDGYRLPEPYALEDIRYLVG